MIARVPPAALACACVLALLLGLAASDLIRVLRRQGPDQLDDDCDRPPDTACASIVILNWNGRALLERCLPRVQDATSCHSGHEIILVDNGSQDDSVAFVRTHFPRVKLLELHTNLGFGAGNNAGVRVARHDIVVLLNNDMLVDPDFLTPLLRAFKRKGMFAATSQVFFQDSKRRREETGRTRAAFVRGMLMPEHVQPNEGSCSCDQPVLWAGGGSSAYDRRKFVALGGFDALFEPAYAEDLDLSYRAWQRGWPSVLVPRSKVWHEHRATSRRRFGDAHVDALIRRNLLLFTWRRLGWAFLLKHAVWLPAHAARWTHQYGRSKTCWILLSAIGRLPRVMSGRACDGPRRGSGDASLLSIGWSHSSNPA